MRRWFITRANVHARKHCYSIQLRVPKPCLTRGSLWAVAAQDVIVLAPDKKKAMAVLRFHSVSEVERKDHPQVLTPEEFAALVLKPAECPACGTAHASTECPVCGYPHPSVVDSAEPSCRLRCPHCGAEAFYRLEPGKFRFKCRQCGKVFTWLEAKVGTVTCPFCNYAWKPRKVKDSYVCPCCRRAFKIEGSAVEEADAHVGDEDVLRFIREEGSVSYRDIADAFGRSVSWAWYVVDKLRRRKLVVVESRGRRRVIRALEGDGHGSGGDGTD